MGQDFGMQGGFFMGDFLFQLVPIFFIVVFGVIIFSIVRNIKEWNENNQQPQLSVAAIVTAKRTKVNRHHHNQENHMHSTTSTIYYVTFEVESGDRMEFELKGREYGQLAEGDKGKLQFQGTRYLGFERIV